MDELHEVLAELKAISAQLAGFDKRLSLIELGLGGHAASQAAQGERIGKLEVQLGALIALHEQEKGEAQALALQGRPTVEQRLAALETIKAEGEGAGKAAKWIWGALTVAAAGAGWLAHHLGLKP